MTADEVYAWFYEQPDPPRALYPAFVCSVLGAWACTRSRRFGGVPDSLFGANLTVWR